MACPPPGLTLDELLSDPLVRLVMASDGVEPEAVARLVGDVARRVRPARSPASAAPAP